MNFRLLPFTVLLIIALAGVSTIANATHLRAGQITIRRITGFTYEIRVEVFTNTINTNVLFGGEDDWLDFGDGVRILIPEQANTLRPDLGEGIATASYTIRHTFPGNGSYIISYSEPNRNQGVINMDNSVNTRFYIETQIVIDPSLANEHTPELGVPPIDRGCTGVKFFHNPGAFDRDPGDSLSYEIVVPFRAKSSQVVNYRSPNDPDFYTDYNTGNEDDDARPSFEINPIDGTLTWDAPGDQGVGEYNIAFIVREWKKRNGRWFSMGFVRRDMQIIVEDCNNERPDLIVPLDTCVVAGTNLQNIEITGTDPDGDRVKIEAFSQILTAEFGATVTPPPAFENQPHNVKFNWQTTCDHVKEQPYLVVFKVTDDGDPNLVTFKTWRITVIGPPPAWEPDPLDQNPANKSATLKWEDYTCDDRAVTMEVWRKVDSLAYEPGHCDTGLPEGLGYTRIASLPIGTTEYTDTNGGKGLAEGVVYCYRLVAIFPDPGRGESIVSEEICTEPFDITEPMIFRVSIENTSVDDGRVRVSWLEPQVISPPFTDDSLVYILQRAQGTSGTFTSITGELSDPSKDTLMYLDDDAGLNTKDLSYSYRVLMYGYNGGSSPIALDTSEVASTVRLDAQSETNRIVLTWDAAVPWTNITPEPHTLYRGFEETPQSEMVPIAEVIPTESGMTYTDAGLDDTKVYSYFVIARGSYGNDDIKAKIAEPLENASQIILAQPSDSLPPCKPTIVVSKIPSCDEYLADQTTCEQNKSYSITITWERPADECSKDIAGYRIYRSAFKDGPYDPLPYAGINGIVRGTEFVDEGLSSLAYCYRVSAIDRSGNESELSDPDCSDTCPFYELPNVFTPNADGCNDRFSAYRSANYYTEPSETGGAIAICGDVNETKCARFVESVHIKIYNRWGKQVFEYASDASSDGPYDPIYIDWDGRATDGSDLASGIYYYNAEVTFDAIDPAKRFQEIKGWVHLVR